MEPITGSVRFAAQYALVKAVRTFAQGAAGALSTAAITVVALPELKATGLLVLAGLLTALVAAAAAFFQNFAEALPES